VYKHEMSVGGTSESAASVRHLIRTVRAHGLELDEGASAGVPIFHARIAVRHACALWERAAVALGPELPLLVATKSPDDHISPLYFAALACGTMGEALQLTVDYWSYATQAFATTVRRTGDAVHLRFELDGPAPLGARLGTEYLLADLARSGHEMSGGAWRPKELVLGHRPPIDLELWEETCGVPVRVDPESPGLVLDADTLDQPVRSALSPSARRFFLEVLDWIAPCSQPATLVGDRVAELVTCELGAATPTVEQVAHALAMSPRTLHRRLAAEGTTYQRVLDETRRDEAIRRALDDQHQLKAIGAELGFADPRGFRRAFKRWTGLTPQQFRIRRRAR
jgi:AraC-like DNA-binding protein